MQRVEWYPFLSPNLLQAAYKVYAKEWAWPKQQALQVIDWLNANGFIVDGVDVWIPTNPGPTIPAPFVYDWMLESLPRGDLYPDTAREFVQNFEWDPTDKSTLGLAPVFNISAKKSA